MSGNRRRKAFTLIEVLLVVVIMAVLAGVVVSKLMIPTEDAQLSTLLHNMHVLRSQTELYRTNHNGNYPTIQGNALPQLTSATNSDGAIGPSGPNYPHGPYIIVMPFNPFDDSDKVTAVATAGVKPTAVSGALGGWQYDETTGDFWPNHPEYYE